MQNLDKRTIEIIAQVTYKEMCDDRRNGVEYEDFWKTHKNETLELARNIYNLNKEINK